jgi:hypothetical protein
MAAPYISDILPDLVEELAYLLRESGAEPLCEQLRALRIESICDCGDEGCGSKGREHSRVAGERRIPDRGPQLGKRDLLHRSTASP